nr:uncharacterized protein LOC113729081 [Coffea arabica]
MSEFYRKMSRVRGKLRAWNKEVFGHIGSRVAELEKVMRITELQYDMERTVMPKIAYHEAMAAYMKQLEGDANTVFFHVVVRQRQASNYIAIRSSTRQWLTKIEDIKCSAASFFETLFKSDRDTNRHPVLPFTLPRVSLGDNERQLALPSMEEVREVVFSISPDSAPGPDGFGSGFYQACWGIIKEELVAVVQDYFKGGLSKLLPQLISPWQFDFVPGHQIIDDVLLTQEHAQELDRQLEIPNLMLKLDMENAYDRVEWSFLLFMLKAFGFQENAVDLIFRLVANNWFSILAGGLKVLYLAFADNIIVFTRLSKETLKAVGDFFKQYQQYPGQKINASKNCFVCSSGVTAAQVDLVSTILGFPRQFFPLVYLGVPISRGRCSSIVFDGILQRYLNPLR